MRRINWRAWKNQLLETISIKGALACVLGTGLISAAGVSISGDHAKAFYYLGVSILLVAFIWVAYVTFPPLIWRPQDLAGKSVGIGELPFVDPPLPTMAIVGIGKTGKTTLKQRLLVKKNKKRRTQGISCYVMPTNSSPVKYVGILDGSGEIHSQQFNIVEMCDILCILVDHNRSDEAEDVDFTRLKEHESFLFQVRKHLDESGEGKKACIYFLVNKRDLWERASKEEISEFKMFYKAEGAKWEEGARANVVEMKSYSNECPESVANLMSSLEEML